MVCKGYEFIFQNSMYPIKLKAVMRIQKIFYFHMKNKQYEAL